MLFRRRTEWPAWGWTSPFEELERMRRQMDWLSGGLSSGLLTPTGIIEQEFSGYCMNRTPKIGTPKLISHLNHLPSLKPGSIGAEPGTFRGDWAPNLAQASKYRGFVCEPLKTVSKPSFRSNRRSLNVDF